MSPLLVGSRLVLCPALISDKLLMLLHLIRFTCGSSSVVLSGHDGLKANVVQTVSSHVVDQVMVVIGVLITGVNA